ncbi:hypothetical protein PVK06_047736 [Gossypium arboreum]|uniref:DUF7866 domain-containing protein n=1 Tax=Gossypium arboreum TaxID=29729 RepID=A0ABR0MED2_GOSAR|nr:hypothetical protein PVK06_047736 [Gossypium arboreum]
MKSPLEVNESLELVPLVDEKMVKMMMFNESRRKLGTFQICAACTCCGGAKGVCLPSPCCYAINCNIPNRPFGFCSFTPKTWVKDDIDMTTGYRGTFAFDVLRRVFKESH